LSFSNFRKVDWLGVLREGGAMAARKAEHEANGGLHVYSSGKVRTMNSMR